MSSRTTLKLTGCGLVLVVVGMGIGRSLSAMANSAPLLAEFRPQQVGTGIKLHVYSFFEQSIGSERRVIRCVA